MGKTNVIGVDIGFGYVKWHATDASGKLHCDLFPSYIGESVTLRATGVRGVDLAGPQSFVVTLNGVKRLVGANAILQSRSRFGAMNESRFADSDTVQVFALCCIGSYLEQVPAERLDGNVFLVVSGIPLSSYLNYRTPMAEALTGPHTFALGSGDKTAQHLASIERAVIVPSPFGPYFDFLMDNDGSAPKNRIFDKVGIVVIGTLTTEFTLMVGGATPQYVDKASASIHVGLSTVTEQVLRFLKDQHNVDADHYAVDAAITSDKFTYGGVNFRDVAASAVEDAGKAIADQMKSLWGVGKDLDAIIASGGAARWISPAVQRSYKHHKYIEPQQAIYSTARGYEKYGRQLASA